MKHRLLCVLALFATVLPAAGAGAQRVSLAVRGSTLGTGVEVTLGLSNALNLRVGANAFSYSRSDQTEVGNPSVKLDIASDVSFSSGTAIFDLNALGPVHLSGGVVLNKNKGTFLATPTDSYTVSDVTFTPDKIGSLTTTVDWETSIAPYVGLGLGNAVAIGKRLGIALDVGAMYTGAPRVTMVGTKLIEPTATQAIKIQDAAKNLTWYPVVGLALSYKIM